MKCTTDMNCYDGEKCINKQCQSGCANDNHCDEGFKCHNMACVKSCQSGQDCPQEHYCNKYCQMPFMARITAVEKKIDPPIT